MQNEYSFKSFIKILLFFLFIYKSRQRVLPKIKAKSYDDRYQISKKCNLSLMQKFGLRGDIEFVGQKNPLCPNIGDNCCGNVDVERIKTYWDRTVKDILIYQRIFLSIAKYILTVYPEFYKLSAKIVEKFEEMAEQGEQANSFMHKNAKVLLNEQTYKIARRIFNFDHRKHRLQAMMDELEYASQFAMNARRSFYCMVCSTEGQNAIKRRNILARLFSYSGFKFDNSFCDMIISNHTMYMFNYYDFMTNYMDFLLELSGQIFIDNKSLKSLAKIRVYSLQKGIYNPDKFNFIDKMSLKACKSNPNFSHCEFFCQNFTMLTANPKIDGDIIHSYMSYQVVNKFKELIGFVYNEFHLDFVVIESFVEENINRVNPHFIHKLSKKSQSIKIIANDFMTTGGVDPMYLARGTTLQTQYAFNNILKIYH